MPTYAKGIKKRDCPLKIMLNREVHVVILDFFSLREGMNVKTTFKNVESTNISLERVAIF